MEQAGAALNITLNDIPFRIVDLAAAAPVIKDDVIRNASRGLCRHKLQ